MHACLLQSYPSSCFLFLFVVCCAGLAPRDHDPPNCKRPFSDAERAVLSSAGERPWVCETCGKGFQRRLGVGLAVLVLTCGMSCYASVAAQCLA
eukprot:2202213-Rhodomonas_salina.1